MIGPKVYLPVQNLSGEVEKPALLWKGREALAADILNRAVAGVGSGVALTSASHPQLNEDSLEGIEIEIIDRSVLPHDAAARKALPITTGVLDYFPLALAEIARVSKAGSEQHHPGEPLHWDKSKSTDHADCIARHLLERGTTDVDGMRHSAKLAWRALALLQIELEKTRT